jgi:hypothetical protein
MSNHRGNWVVPGSRQGSGHGFLAPESGWTDLLCARVREFLGMFPVDWWLFDWFGYGGLRPDEDPVVPAGYAKAPFKRIIAREMPKLAAEITPDEQLRYKRAVLAERFSRLREAVKTAGPLTRILFNVPCWKAAEVNGEHAATQEPTTSTGLAARPRLQRCSRHTASRSATSNPGWSMTVACTGSGILISRCLNMAALSSNTPA